MEKGKYYGNGTKGRVLSFKQNVSRVVIKKLQPKKNEEIIRFEFNDSTIFDKFILPEELNGDCREYSYEAY